MPRPEDIAWKFVIRRGKKWRCPYCEIEYSGSVTRVRSHFLKQTKEGIVSCKKVPEHISALMELLQNEVHNKEDIAWKFVDRLEDSKWRCHYCSGEFSGGLTGVKRHLLKVPNEGISICTDVPVHVINLWLSLLDEVGEEESREVAGEQSREAPGQSSVEPQSRDMPTQAEVAEEESREANSQFPTIPESPDMPPPAVPFSPLSVGNDIDYFLATGEPATDMGNFTSDQERQCHGTLLDGVGEEESREVAGEQSREAPGQSSVEPQSRDMPTQAEGAEKESGEANRQFPMEPQSRDMQSSPVDSSSHISWGDLVHTYREASSTTAEGVTNMAKFNSDHQQGEHQFHEPLAMRSLAQNSHGKHVTGPLESPEFFSPDFLEHMDHMEQAGGQFHVDHIYRSEDCSQPCVVEGVPLLSNTSPANAVQHPDQLNPRCDKEDGNGTCLFPLPTRMDIDPPIAPLHRSVSLIIEATTVDLQVPVAATNAIGPSSSQDIEQGFFTQEHDERHCMSRPLEQERILGNGRAAPIGASHPPNVEGATNLQFPQDVPPLTQSSESLEEMAQDARVINITNSPMDGAPSYYSAKIPPNSSFTDEDLTYIMEHLDLERLNAQQGPGAPLPSPDRQHTDYNLNELQGSNLPGPISSDTQLSKMATTNTPQHSSQPLPSDSQCGFGTGLVPPITSLPFNGPVIVDSVDPLQIPEDIINTIGPRTSEGMLKGAPAGTSAFQHDRTNIPHSDEPLPSCNEECGTETSSFPLRESMDIYPLTATHVDLQFLENEANMAGPSSSQELDMDEGAPMMSHPNTGSNFEGNRVIKRKLNQLYSREVHIRNELKYAASLSLKKPRREVAKWLMDVEKLKNNFSCKEATSEDCLPPRHHQVDMLMQKAEDLMGHSNFPYGLFEARETKVHKLLEGKMVGEGFQSSTTKILEYLVGNQVSRLGIYGMGGVGKTTIMKHIHNRLLEKANYGNVLWITVPQDFNTQKLQDDIWEALGLGTLLVKDVSKRAAMLSNCLIERGKSTIILDDVWDYFDLEEVGIPIKVDGFKLVLTTRLFNVCCQMQCQEKIKIEPLSPKEAKSLFLEELGSEVALDLEIEAIVESIVKECAGLPLGVITMAASMRGVTDVFEWKDCLVKLKESDMRQTDMEKKVLMKLEVSYDRLRIFDVQQCFLSCALYPEDELIDKLELVEFFIDQGLIGGLNTRREQHDRGLTILNKLGNVCLLEDHGRKMKMHDLIRDMALHIMSATSIVKPRKGLMGIPLEECWTEALEKVSLIENKISEFPLNMSPNCPKLSTLLLNDNQSNDVVIIPDSFFRQFCGLKVLNLSGCHLRELPNSISDLVNLRALLLSWCWELRHIPYLGKLTSLRKLDIDGRNSLEVLEGLEMLMNLRYLALGFSMSGRLPKGVLGGLLNLQHLKVGILDGEDITKLRALETLECYFEDADDFNKCVRFIEQVKLQYYRLRMYRQCDFYEDEESDCAQERNEKRKVNILRWSHAILSMGGERTGIFILIPRDVQILVGMECDGLKNLSGIGPLEYLEELIIEEWEKLEVLRGGHDEEVIDIHDSPAPTPTPLLFPSLRVLRISECPKLKYLFGHGFISNLPHLQEIEISDCEEMVRIIAKDTSPPPHPLPVFPFLREIHVWRCDKMKRAVESEWLPYFPNMRRIDVTCCEKMEEIIGGPPPHVLVEKISLESLSAFGCDNMRKLFPRELLLHLRTLQQISVFHCEGMVEMISGTGQGQEGSIMTPVNNTPSSFQSSISLPNMRELDLCKLPQLKSICEVPISCGSMDNLRVYECPELKRIPLQLRLRDMDIEDLPHIWVEDEEKWKTLMWDDPNAQAILQPYLRKGTHANRPFQFDCRCPPDAIELDAKRKDLPW